ncbi:MAG: RsmE family RNA methyltransferase [Candidatus Stygibacter frigidus]|nr:RsmE family RNA methyltransferase [Candidatus Stygibacter frigidus]
MPCYYLPDITNLQNRQYIIEGEEYHHICQVLRKRDGDHILVTSGTGIIADCRIVKIEKRYLLIEIENHTTYERSEPQMALAFALLKNKHDSMIIEKTTELGCSIFYPMETERTIRRNSSNQQNKFHKIAIAAMKQCDNAWLPEIKECRDIRKIPDLLRKDSFIPVVALETENKRSFSEIKSQFPNESLGIIIGPEGGFSQQEIEFLKKSDVISFSLGNHILRAETAAITAISQLSGFNYNLNREYY